MTLTDNGTLSFAAGDTVTLPTLRHARRSWSATAACSTTTSTATFSGSTNLTPPRSSSTPAATSRPAAAPSPSARSTLNAGTVFNPGDLTGNGFDSPLYLPASDVQYLSGTGSNNLQFQDIDILADTIVSGQTLALNAIGTATTANLRYVFPGSFTVSSGATVTVGRQRQRADPGERDADRQRHAELRRRRRGDLEHRHDADRGRQRRPADDRQRHSFSGSTNCYTQIVVNCGGHLQASDSTFALNKVTLNAGSIFNAGDLTGNSFNSPLYLPASDVQYLSGTGSNNLSSRTSTSWRALSPAARRWR